MSSEMEVVRRRMEIEMNLERCRDAAAENLIEIGRWLLRAKEERIVEHGAWADWVMEHAGMNERTAQRAMQFARELPEGSALARLGVAKISSLLTLPAGEREDVARSIGAETISSREVDAKVREIRRERDEALRLVGEQKKRHQEQEAVLKKIRGELEQARANRQEAIDSAVETERKAARVREAQAIEAKEDELRTLRGLLQDAMDRAQSEMSELATAKLMRMQGELEEALQTRRALEQEIDSLSDKLDEAQTALMRGAMTGTERTAPSVRILSAIGAFMTEAGSAAGELERTACTLDEESRALLIGQAQLLGALAMRVIAACGGDTHGCI